MKPSAKELIGEISKLVGKPIEGTSYNKALESLKVVFKQKEASDKFGYRQINELLLLCNERIVSKEFFKFLAGGKETIAFKDFKNKVNIFRKLAILQFGSFRFAFNYLCSKKNIDKELGRWVIDYEELVKEFKSRQKPLREIEPIPENKLHWLGYLRKDNVNLEELDRIRRKGQRNFETYLTYDYLDVYVATSMRQEWEYRDVNSICKEVFNGEKLKSINVRYFDPTQSYHENSIAKSLIEGLMLKRAKCTLYLVQETDTMGKDSEMASTLAQGKPVVAYVPKIILNKRILELKNVSLENLLGKADLLKPEVSPADLPQFNHCVGIIISLSEKGKAHGMTPRKLLSKHKSEYNMIIQLIAKYEAIFYDKRADQLKYKHLLRIQIDLKNGVANGVLVARSLIACVNIIYKILTNSLKFDIIEPNKKISPEEAEADKLNYRLAERTTRCAFRVVTEDEMLTNSFWNLYKLGERDE